MCFKRKTHAIRKKIKDITTLFEVACSLETHAKIIGMHSNLFPEKQDEFVQINNKIYSIVEELKALIKDISSE